MSNTMIRGSSNDTIIQDSSNDSFSDDEDNNNPANPEDIEDIYNLHSSSENISVKRKNEKIKRRQERIAKLIANAEAIIVENSLPLLSTYVSYAQLLHDVGCLNGPWNKDKKITWKCKKCSAKLLFREYKDEYEKKFIVLKKYVKHIDSCIPVANMQIASIESVASAKFPIPASTIIPLLKIPIIQNPTLETPVLLNFLEASLGSLFNEMKRSKNGTRPYAYTAVYNARRTLRKTYCGDMTEYEKLPAIIEYIKSLDKDTDIFTKIDPYGNFENIIIIPGMCKRAIHSLLNFVILDAAHMKGLGTINGYGKSYLAVLLDGNHNTHLLGIGIGKYPPYRTII